MFENNINRLAAAGITSGCTPTTYCPNLDVTRGQMAAFLHRAFGP
jgi:S-layer homology domain